MGSDVREVRLDNGFRALLVERRGLPLVASMICYSTGSRDERTGETGLSHFLEHMMFKGTRRYAKGEIDAITGKLGGSNNAFTDHDWTAYYFNLASDRWETALEIEADRMVDCLLDPAEFEAEKSVVLEELAMGEDDPWTTLWHAGESLAFDVHPYRHPVIGYRQDLERATPERMREYLPAQLRPEPRVPGRDRQLRHQEDDQAHPRAVRRPVARDRPRVGARRAGHLRRAPWDRARSG